MVDRHVLFRQHLTKKSAARDLTTDQPSSTEGVATSELLLLIKQALDFLEQEGAEEDAALLALAHEQLSPDRIEFADVRDTILQEYVKYQDTWRIFRESGIRFARAYEEQQARVATFRKVLNTLVGDMARPCRSSEIQREVQSHASPSALRSENYSDYPSWAAAGAYEQSDSALPELSITCFGRFEIRRTGEPIVLCSNRNAQTILRYLVAQDNYSASAEKLLEVIWPEDEPKVAKNKLHIAISALRRSLHAGLPNVTGSGYLVCENHIYSLNPAVVIRTDVAEFLHYYQMGEQRGEERIAFYERACQLYKGPFLPEDLHADWSFLLREQFNYTYFIMCRALAAHYLQIHCYESAAKWAMKILTWDNCDEAAHRQLMQIYAAQGCRSKAIQQYYHCERILRQELGVEPLPATVQLFQTLLQGSSAL